MNWEELLKVYIIAVNLALWGAAFLYIANYIVKTKRKKKG